MSAYSARNCPLCGSRPRGLAFPYATIFDSTRFEYLRCEKCSSVFVDPVPSDSTFQKMYAKSEYHDQHYQDADDHQYAESARLLKLHLSPGALVMDYGCGTGKFLQALRKEGFVPYGIEFDPEAARFAAKSAGCKVVSVKYFDELAEKPLFDAIHLGDVLEHLPDPAGTLESLLVLLKPHGLLFVEGPLETNPSLVYWAARSFGLCKRLLRPGRAGTHPPTHLFRTNGRQQLKFFQVRSFALEPVAWNVSETGWPYASGGALKRCIAHAARLLGGWKFLETTFGNRFSSVFVNRLSQTDHNLRGRANDA